MLLKVVSMLPFLPVFIFIWMRVAAGIWDPLTWAAIGVFVAGGLFGLWWQH